MVLVPLLVHFCGMDSKKAFASALSIMLPISLVSLAVCRMTGMLPVKDTEPYLLGGLLGGLLAGICYKKIPTTLLHRVMGILILWGGFRYLC